MKKLAVLITIFISQLSVAKEKMTILKSQEELVQAKYNALHFHGETFLLCIDAIDILVSSTSFLELDSADKLKFVSDANSKMKISCANALRGKIESSYIDSIERAVENQAVSESLYVYFVQSLVFAQMTSQNYTKGKEKSEFEKQMVKLRDPDYFIKEAGIPFKSIARLKARYQKIISNSK